MDQEPSPAGSASPPEDVFASLGWDLLDRCAGTDEAVAALALERFCLLLRPTVLAYVRVRCACEQDAEDLTQDFFVHVIGGNILLRADPARGSLRAFVFTVLQRHLNHARERRRATKRGGGLLFVPLEDGDALKCPAQPEPVRRRAQEAHLDRRWAEALVAQARRRLAADGLPRLGADHPARLLSLLHDGGGPAGSEGAVIPTPETAREMGLSLPAFKSSLHRVRGRYRRLLREAVTLAALGGSVISEDDLLHLCAALVANVVSTLG